MHSSRNTCRSGGFRQSSIWGSSLSSLLNARVLLLVPSARSSSPTLRRWKRLRWLVVVLSALSSFILLTKVIVLNYDVGFVLIVIISCNNLVKVIAYPIGTRVCSAMVIRSGRGCSLAEPKELRPNLPNWMRVASTYSFMQLACPYTHTHCCSLGNLVANWFIFRFIRCSRCSSNRGKPMRFTSGASCWEGGLLESLPLSLPSWLFRCVMTKISFFTKPPSFSSLFSLIESPAQPICRSRVYLWLFALYLMSFSFFPIQNSIHSPKIKTHSFIKQYRWNWCTIYPSTCLHLDFSLRKSLDLWPKLQQTWVYIVLPHQSETYRFHV